MACDWAGDLVDREIQPHHLPVHPGELERKSKDLYELFNWLKPLYADH